jgi:predicted N-acetyltransferase YhbS
MHIETNNKAHLPDFVRLNEIWISEHFSIEEADKTLASNPGKVIDNGGFVFSAITESKIVGVCALFKDEPQRFQLARMAVEPKLRGNGYGRALIKHALQQAKSVGATSVYLLSNTVLEPAIALYERFGFIPVSQGQHPIYARCNIVMERTL